MVSRFAPQLKRGLVIALIAAGCSACSNANEPSGQADPSATNPSGTVRPQPGSPANRDAELTISFAGDAHFESHLAQLLKTPDSALKAIRPVLSKADVTMVNLETAITTRGRPEPKEYNFRTDARALDVLHAAGADVVTMANNHGADYGEIGLRDTLDAIAESPVPVVGVGQNISQAFTPHQVTRDGITYSFFAADTIPLQSKTSVWTAGPDNPGVAAARSPQANALVGAIRRAKDRGEVAIVYMHWGEENVACPPASQRNLATRLTDAGADIIVGSHSHVLMASGWRGDTYLNYGLGNFVWYHDHSPETGVLTLTLRGGKVVKDDWTPARIPKSGVPYPLSGDASDRAIEAWRSLRGCTSLSGEPPKSTESDDSGSSESGSTPGGDGQTEPGDPAAELGEFQAEVSPIGASVQERMAGHFRPRCPVSLGDLRYLTLSYVGFDGRSHEGELIVHRRYATDVVGVFRRLYQARYPIAQMRLVDEFAADNKKTLAANNTSGFHCRDVVDTGAWSDHAYGAAIDINPIQNPYVFPDEVRPPNGTGFSRLKRVPGSRMPFGALASGDLVVRAFADIGWRWGAEFSDPDYQHFFAANSPRGRP